MTAEVVAPGLRAPRWPAHVFRRSWAAASSPLERGAEGLHPLRAVE
jgi:hypothetical protein